MLDYSTLLLKYCLASNTLTIRAEETEKAETERKVRERWNNITNYELTVLEIMSITQKCVPNPSVDPVIESMYNSIDTHTKEISMLKTLASEVYKEGKLGWELADKFEVI